MLIAFDLKKPPHLGEIGAQSGRSFLGLQPSGHRDSKIHPEGLGLLMCFVALLDGSVTLLTGGAVLRAKSFFSLAQLVPLPA